MSGRSNQTKTYKKSRTERVQKVTNIAGLFIKLFVLFRPLISTHFCILMDFSLYWLLVIVNKCKNCSCLEKSQLQYILATAPENSFLGLALRTKSNPRVHAGDRQHLLSFATVDWLGLCPCLLAIYLQRYTPSSRKSCPMLSAQFNMSPCAPNVRQQNLFILFG